MRRAAWALLILLQGASALGSLETSVDGDVRFPPGSFASLDALLLYAEDASQISVLEIEAARVFVREHDVSYLRADAAGGRTAIRHDRATWEASDVRIVLEGDDHAGYFAAVPTASFAAEGRGEPSVDASLPASYGESLTPSSDHPTFGARVDAPHLRVASPMRWELAGDGTLKVVGPDVRLTSSVNQTSFTTGSTPSPGGLPEERVVWVEFDLSDTRITLEGTALVAASEGRVEWTGTAWIGGDPLEGEGTAILTPEGLGDAATIRVSATTGTGGGAQVPGPAQLSSGGILAGALGGIALGGMLTYLAVRSRRPHALTVEECVRLAQSAAEDESYDEAIGWTRRARALSPGSRRLALDEVDFAMLAGRHADALAALGTLPAGAERDIRLARLHAEMGDRDEEAAAALLRALADAPALVLEIEGSPPLRRLTARSDLRRAIADARAALGPP